MSATPARLYLLAVNADSVADGLRPLALLKALGRDDVTAFAVGPLGGWTRLLAPHLGAPVVYGRRRRARTARGAGPARR